MSVLGDAVQTLNEDIEVAAFLPGVNYVYLHITSIGSSDKFFWLAFAASVVGAALFNHLRSLVSDEAPTGEGQEENEGEEASEEWEDPRDDVINQSNGHRQISQQTTSALLLLPWGVLLLVSMYFLLERFSRNWVLPEMLFFISVGFIALYLTDPVLKRWVYDYGE